MRRFWRERVGGRVRPSPIAVVVLAALAVILPAWALYLALVLPREHVAPNWDVLWTGFDLGLATLAAVALVALRRHSRWTPLLAGALAAALVCDAWFDILTSAGDERWQAIGLAALVELPVAAIATVVGVHSTRPG